jgi:hypothetical protein
MNRRTFFTSLFGLAIAPSVAIKVLSAPPTHKYSGLVGYKGTEFMRAGVINAPYIPLFASVKPMAEPNSKVFRITHKHHDNVKRFDL